MDNQNWGGFQPEKQGYGPYPPVPPQGYAQLPYPQQGYQPPAYPQDDQSIYPAGLPQTGMPFPPVAPATGDGAEAPSKKKKVLLYAVTAVVAVLVIVGIVAGFFLTGDKDEKVFYGDWIATIDATDQFKNGIGDVAKYLTDYRFDIEYDFTFFDDGTYYLQVNEKGFNQTVGELTPYLKNAILDYYRNNEMLGKTDEEIEQSFQKQNSQSLDDFVAQYVGKIQYKDFADGINCNGKYKVKGKKLYLSGGVDNNIDDGCYYTYSEVSDNVISLDEYYKDGNFVQEESYLKLVKKDNRGAAGAVSDTTASVPNTQPPAKN